jgi:hypothetical protein
MAFRSVRVAAILVRRRNHEAARYREGPRRDAWPLIVPEITWSASPQTRSL